ncbi:phosphatase PAP2 family protein [archaeon]|jgi:undecaprenyl-diphosphatase|nr:phosphatase PAP2 family protein [archaeon]
MKKRDYPLIILLLTTILTLITFIYDSQIIRFIQPLHNAKLDYIFNSVAYASNILIIFFFLTSLFLWKEHKRRWILPLWLSGVISIAISYILKVSVHRLRPFQKEPIEIFVTILYFMKDNFNTWNFSFPSFQSMFVFSSLPILTKEFPRFKYIWLIFACLVAFSRVYFGAHYLSDVMAGAIIGYLIGYIIVKLEEKYQTSLRITKKLKLAK